MQLELTLSAGNVVAAVFSLVAGIFGMDTPLGWNEDHPEAFTRVRTRLGLECF